MFWCCEEGGRECSVTVVQFKVTEKPGPVLKSLLLIALINCKVLSAISVLLDYFLH